MTNAELIATIRNEIERLKSIEYPCDNSQQATGFFNALDRMTDFLDTLESGKPMNPNDSMKELDEKIALVKQRGTWDGVDVDKYMDEMRGREPEKPCHTVEEWMEHIKNADALTKAIFSKGPYNVLYDALNRPYRDCYDAIKEFGELCYQTARQDMMKDAVEGTVMDFSSNRPRPQVDVLLDAHKYHTGDKVRIIIVKED